MNDKEEEKQSGYQAILAKQDKENPCVSLSKGDGFLSLRLEFRFKSGKRISFAYHALNQVSYQDGTLTFQFQETEITVKGLALVQVFEAVNFHRVLYLAEGDNQLAAKDGEPFIEKINLKKSGQID